MGLLNSGAPHAVGVLVKNTNRPRSWVITASLVLAASLMAAVPALAVPAGPALLKVTSGTATFCLDPQARQALDDAGIAMSAGAPAQLLTVGPQPCVTTYVDEGAVSLGLTGGDFPFDGSIVFTRASDAAAVTFTEIGVTFGVPGTVTAKADSAAPITLLDFIVLPGNIMTDGRYLIAHDVPLNLTAAGVDAFATAFGDSPVETGESLFSGTGHGYLEAGTLLPALG